jgi:hypothetical protein
MRPLPPSCGASGTLSHCNPFSWSILQLRCSCLFPAAPATIMRPLPPSCRASATLNHWNPFSWPIIPLECSYLFPAAPATIMLPLPPLCSPCTIKLLLPAGRLLLFCSLGPSFPAWSPWPSLGGGPVAAQNLQPSVVVDPRMSWGGNLPEACLYKPVPVLYVSLTSYTGINHHSLHISIK